MADTIIGIFTDSKVAGEAVSELKNQGFAGEITVIAKDEGEEAKTHEIKDGGEVSDGVVAGAAGGAAIGGLAALLAGLSSVTIPGIGVVIAGTLATILAGVGIGALAGGIVGALADWGVPDKEAKDMERKVKEGQILIAVSTSDPKAMKIMGNKGGQTQQYFSNSP